MWNKTPRANAKKTKSALRLVLILLVLVTVCMLAVVIVRGANRDTLKFGSQILQLEIVDNADLRKKGLSGRESLLSDQGMLFVFDSPGVECFWMKDMKFPIDIVWLDEQKQVVHMKENVTPESYPESFCPKTSAKYVLEVRSGLAKEQNIRIGSQL